VSPARRVLQILSVAGLVAFFAVRVERTEDANGTTVRMTTGLWFSPWYIDVEENQPPRKFARHREMTLLSWSWLCLIPAALYTHRVVQPPDPPAEANP
jgi:hypothetical protein